MIARRKSRSQSPNSTAPLDDARYAPPAASAPDTGTSPTAGNCEIIACRRTVSATVVHRAGRDRLRVRPGHEHRRLRPAGLAESSAATAGRLGQNRRASGHDRGCHVHGPARSMFRPIENCSWMLADAERTCGGDCSIARIWRAALQRAALPSRPSRGVGARRDAETGSWELDLWGRSDGEEGISRLRGRPENSRSPAVCANGLRMI